MEHVLSIVNDFFGNFLAISNYLWAFPTQYGWWNNIPILGQFTLPVIMLFSAGIIFTKAPFCTLCQNQLPSSARL